MTTYDVCSAMAKLENYTNIFEFIQQPTLNNFEH